jgi:predicted nucleotide-binding protein
VFIVHGHDPALKAELARLLERLGLEPVILHERADRGAAILEKLSREMSDVGFAFVLLTPDDLGAASDRPADLKHRARQNVVFEHGMLVAWLDGRVCAITKGPVEIPSDLHGVLYRAIPAGGSILSIAYDIVTELRAAGYKVDANRI